MHNTSSTAPKPLTATVSVFMPKIKSVQLRRHLKKAADVSSVMLDSDKSAAKYFEAHVRLRRLALQKNYVSGLPTLPGELGCLGSVPAWGGGLRSPGITSR